MTAATLGGQHRREGRRTALDLAPHGADVVDVGFLLILSSLGMLGFRHVYGGDDYLVVAAIAFALGVVLAHLTNRTRQPLLVVAVLTTALFFISGGGGALRDTTIGHVVPTLRSLTGLAGAAVHSWKQLLTTLHPVGDTDTLLVIPYLLGLGVGVLGFSLARRSRVALLPTAPAGILVVLSILFGGSRPTAALLQGAVFAVVALAWATIRAARDRPAMVGSRNAAFRGLSAAMVLALGLVAAWGLGPRLPFAHHHSRVVLTALPPFDPGAYASPLSAFRQYTKNDVTSLARAPLLTVSGYPEDGEHLIQIAVLDAYDGVVWGASNSAPAGQREGGFYRIGTAVPNAISTTGTEADVTVTIQPAYAQHVMYWLPLAGGLSHLSFGSGSSNLGSDVRYDLNTGTGLIPGGLPPGTTYTIHVIPTSLEPTSSLADAVPGGSASLPTSASQIQTVANRWATDASTPLTRVVQIANHLKSAGAYSDGSDGLAGLTVLPGQNISRLLNFVQATQPVGDPEQYASAMALMADAEGVPARVVLGATVPSGGVVLGSDVTATVQLLLAGQGWTTLDPNDFTPSPTKKPHITTPVTNRVTSPPVPPATRTTPVNTSPNSSQPKTGTSSRAQHRGHALLPVPHAVIVAASSVIIPLLLLLGICLTIVGLKARRRRLRRQRGTPTARVAAGWREVVDRATDFGFAVPRDGTRREIVRSLGELDVDQLARDADAIVFGPGLPEEVQIDAYWRNVEAARLRIGSDLSRWRRMRAALSLRTFSRPLDVAAVSRSESHRRQGQETRTA